MIEKELLLLDLQKQLHAATDDTTKVTLSEIIADVLTGKFNVRVW